MDWGLSFMMLNGFTALCSGDFYLAGLRFCCFGVLIWLWTYLLGGCFIFVLGLFSIAGVESGFLVTCLWLVSSASCLFNFLPLALEAPMRFLATVLWSWFTGSYHEGVEFVLQLGFSGLFFGWCALILMVSVFMDLLMVFCGH